MRDPATCSATIGAMPGGPKSTRIEIPRWVQLVGLPLLLVLAWVVAGAVRHAVFIFLVALLIALLLNPLVRALGRVWIPRGLAVAIVYLSFAGAVALAILDLIPPPFPFTPFVLAAGALQVDARTFFVTLADCRMVRFGLEAALANLYGPRILAWLDSDRSHDIVSGIIVLALLLSTISLLRLLQSSRRRSRIERVRTSAGRLSRSDRA